MKNEKKLKTKTIIILQKTKEKLELIFYSTNFEILMKILLINFKLTDEIKINENENYFGTKLIENNNFLEINYQIKKFNEIKIIPKITNFNQFILLHLIMTNETEYLKYHFLNNSSIQHQVLFESLLFVIIYDSDKMFLLDDTGNEKMIKIVLKFFSNYLSTDSFFKLMINIIRKIEIKYWKRILSKIDTVNNIYNYFYKKKSILTCINMLKIIEVESGINVCFSKVTELIEYFFNEKEKDYDNYIELLKYYENLSIELNEDGIINGRIKYEIFEDYDFEKYLKNYRNKKIKIIIFFELKEIFFEMKFLKIFEILKNYEIDFSDLLKFIKDYYFEEYVQFFKNKSIYNIFYSILLDFDLIQFFNYDNSFGSFGVDDFHDLCLFLELFIELKQIIDFFATSFMGFGFFELSFLFYLILNDKDNFNQLIVSQKFIFLKDNSFKNIFFNLF
jgi:hypothetical protein